MYLCIHDVFACKLRMQYYTCTRSPGLELPTRGGVVTAVRRRVCNAWRSTGFSARLATWSVWLGGLFRTMALWTGETHVLPSFSPEPGVWTLVDFRVLQVVGSSILLEATPQPQLFRKPTCSARGYIYICTYIILPPIIPPPNIKTPPVQIQNFPNTYLKGAQYLFQRGPYAFESAYACAFI